MQRDADSRRKVPLNASSSHFLLSSLSRLLLFITFVLNTIPYHTTPHDICSCQELDFDGWPPEEEAPAMTAEQIDVISLRCSHQEDPKMPKPRLLTSTPDQSSPTATSKSSGSTSAITSVTPPPGGAGGLATSPKNRNKQGQNIGVGVTPSPFAGGEEEVSKPQQPIKNKPSAKLTELHKKWQAEAEKVGGKGARVVCSKPEAKKIIRDVLYERFGPMNITEIYTALNATVPSVILRVCLDEMVFDDTPKDGFDDSDDEHEGNNSKKKKKKSAEQSSSSSDPYASTVLMKEGRNMSNNLYFLDQTKGTTDNNGGNGLTPDHRNQLDTDFAQATADGMDSKDKLQQLTKEATQLLSEPTNEEIGMRLDNDVSSMKELNDKLLQFRELKVHEASRKKTQKGIEYFASVWRSRKRMCSDFLISMEECTEGSVSMKKCLNGDGQIELDGDEAIVKAVVDYGKRKRQTNGNGNASASRSMANHKRSKVAMMSSGSGNAGGDNTIVADQNFVGVRLDSGGLVSRVHLDD
jgi:hypothetical protein